MTNKKMVSYTIEAELFEKMKTLPRGEKSGLVERLLREHFAKTPELAIIKKEGENEIV